MTLEEILDEVFFYVQEARQNNDRLDDTLTKTAVNAVYRDVAARGRCFVGQVTISTLDDVGVYARPVNMLSDFICVRRSLASVVTATPLVKDSRRHMMGVRANYRSTTKGTPTHWFTNEGRFFEVWPRPAVTACDALIVEGFLLPSLVRLRAAANITGATNATPIVCTSATHGLQTGEWLRISGITGLTAANGIWRITWASANTYSLDDSAGNGVFGGTGVADVLGIPPLAETHDEPQFSEQFHRMLVDGTVYRLLSRPLADDGPGVLAKAQAAKADYEEWIPQVAAFYAGGPR